MSVVWFYSFPRFSKPSPRLLAHLGWTGNPTPAVPRMLSLPSGTSQSSKSQSSHATGVATVPGPPSGAKIRRGTVARGSRALSPSPPRAHVGESHVSALVTSPHPDAVRRRREAEERRIQRTAELESTVAAINGHSTGDLPGNLLQLDVASELDFRLRMGSRGNRLVVAHFKASWCAACARMQYKIKQIAEQNPDVTFLVVDVSKNPDLLEASTELGVEKLPYFLFYKNEEQVASFSCNLSKINLLRAEVAGHKDSQGKC